MNKIAFAVCAEHDQMLPLIKWARREFGPGAMLVNVDSHSDMDMFKGRLNIGNFITKALGDLDISGCLWIRDKHSTDFEDGLREFHIWPDPNRPGFLCNMEECCYLLTDSFRRETPAWASAATFQVLSESSLAAAKISPGPWILSIDCDYFSTVNPCREILAQELTEIDPKLVSEATTRLSNLKTEGDWLRLQADLVSRGLLEKFHELAEIAQPNKIFTDDEIDTKIDRVFSFLSRNLDPAECRGIFICESLSSGFTPREKFRKISTSLMQRIFLDYGERLMPLNGVNS